MVTSSTRPAYDQIDGVGLSQVIGAAYFRRGVTRLRNLRSRRRKSNNKAPSRLRARDILSTKQWLYQLSYRSTFKT